MVACPACGFFGCHGGDDCKAPERMYTPDTKTRACFGKEQGLHLDGEKPRIADMIPADLILEAGRIFAQNNQPRPGYPEGKYPDIDGRANYKSGIRLTRLMDSMMRHLLALMNGEDSDPDSGFDHAGHLLCNLSMFWWIRANCDGMDDR